MPVGFGGSSIIDASPQACLFLHTFEGTIQAQDRFLFSTASQSYAQAAGYGTLNSGSTTTSGHRSLFVSWRAFPLYTTGSTLLVLGIKHTNDSATNSFSEWGFGQFPLSNATANDGVYFRTIVTGGITQLVGVVNYNAAEIVTVLRTGVNVPASGVHHRYGIEIQRDIVVFYIDDDPAGSIKLPNTVPSSTSGLSQPIGFRIGNTGAASAARQISVAFVGVYVRGWMAAMPWGHQQVAGGGGAYLVQPGNATTFTATWPNSAAPANATGTNNTAAYTGLGGEYRINAAAGAETDIELFQYVNPGTSVNRPAKTLYVTGVRIGEMVNTGAVVTTTATCFAWFCATGFATDLSFGFGINTFGPCRIPLGSHSFLVGAGIGAVAPGFAMDFSAAPIVVPAGAAFFVCYKQYIGSATASEVFRGTVAVAGYHE
jgi:hypothetical protein